MSVRPDPVTSELWEDDAGLVWVLAVVPDLH